uniref:receptor protein serine/threonine kinase n=1 Tax=Fundulus heteroclitus TaxID=8078 RepID=A0A3Q2NU41_FUNHE
CRMAHGVTRGLAFLHTELYRGDQYKPPVAHRDLTSRNVLVRSDLSCVLADFGLSMKLTGTRTCRPGDDDTMAISEVGTVRYMSPEVLGGALNLRDCESALKQVDVYALGLLYWESFRRCSDLFPGEAVPEYQLAFQAEVGNHPSFEDMQILVVREKHRPRFPEVWKENSLALRALKETMEDCWDQDAEARLTAQCAEERLADLIILSPHTALHNHRNLSHSCWTPQVGSSSCYIEDLRVGVVKNLQGDGQPASVVRTTMSGAEGGEKNRNCINQQRQQVEAQQARPAALDGTLGYFFYCNSFPVGGAASSVPVCLQLTEEDLEASKLDPKQKNLSGKPDGTFSEAVWISTTNLPPASQHGGKTSQLHSVPEELLLNAVTPVLFILQVTSQEEPGPPASIQPLPKQQNLPQRPTSLHLLPKPSESRQKPGSNPGSPVFQVETGVAKMNAVIPPVEPHLVTTVTKMRSSAANGPEVLCASSSHSSGVPVLVTNKTRGGGRTNPAGPQEEEEEEDGGGRRGGDGDNQLNLSLNFSPDEHEPLLRREQLPAESDPPPPPHHHHGPPGRAGGRGSNSNNNNNRLALTLDPAPAESPASEPADLQNRPSEPQTVGLLQPQLRQTKNRRPERPCSLDLSSSCISSGGLSATGEKIKRRVKTPYTLKKWRPASWVVSTDRDLDLEFEFTSSQVQESSGLHRAEGAGVPRINQSKSSMAVFLVGGGTTATTTSEPDGLTRF